MMLKEQVFAHALLLAGDLTPQETDLLNTLCLASTSSLTARLKKELTPEDCKADFIAAAKANYENVRAEDGCIFYHLNEPTDAGVGAPVDPDECVYVECWESAEHLQKHLQQPHMKALSKK